MGVETRRSAIRSAGRAARRGVTGEARRRAESQLLVHLLSLHALAEAAGDDGPVVSCFVAHDGEPDMAGVGDALWARGRRLALPVLAEDPADFTMRFLPWLPGDELTAGRYGIPVPPRREPVEPGVLLVPLVAFDSGCNRMGRGAGIYDRYLEHCDGMTIGVAFEAQRVDDLAPAAHDVRLAAVVTDLGVRVAPAEAAIA